MRCPGQDTQYWKPGAIYEADCPNCGRPVEFFKDDTMRRCRHCDHRFVNPSLDFGCASYCQYAEQCLGNLPPELLAEKEDLLKDRVAIEVKRHYRTDFKKIGRISRRARYAEAIGKLEKANLGVVLTAAYLYDLGPVDGAPSVAETILEKLGARGALIRDVLAVIGPSAGIRPIRRIVADAEEIARTEELRQSGAPDTEDLAREIVRRMETEGGRSVARQVLFT
jgi:hypothetical protein